MLTVRLYHDPMLIATVSFIGLDHPPVYTLWVVRGGIASPAIQRQAEPFEIRQANDLLLAPTAVKPASQFKS